MTRPLEYPVIINLVGLPWTSSSIKDSEGLILDIPRQEIAADLLPCISQLMSDVVLFSVRNLDDAVNLFLDWVACCSRLSKVSHDKPSALVRIRGAESSVSLGETFMTACLKSSKARDMDKSALEAYFLSYVVIGGRGGKAMHCLDICVQDLMDIARRVRTARYHLWSLTTYQSLHYFFARALIEETLSADSLVREFSDYRKLCLARERLWPEILERHQDMTSIQQFVIPLMAHCLARRALLCSHVFRATEQCKALYSELCRSYFLDESGKCLKLLEYHIAKAMCSYQDDLKRANSAHFHKFKIWSEIWRTTFPSAICYSCIEEACEIVFPCGHALCELCYRSLAAPRVMGRSLRVHTGALACSECPFCSTKWDNFKIILSPPTASCRTLVLDGGGTRGIVSLETLRFLEQSTLLDLPIRVYFDLIVGTSTGGITAIGLGLKKWDLRKCMESFLSLVHRVFPRGHSWIGQSNFLEALACMFHGSRYNHQAVEDALYTAFGDTDMRGGLTDPDVGGQAVHATRVAIIATESNKATIFTNYNKVLHTEESSYVWAQGSNKFRKIKAWVVARCTSAAPYYFTPKSLSYETYEDGGLVYNYPGPVAESEARKIYPHARPLIITLGCGIQSSPETLPENWLSRYRNSFVYRFYRSSLKNLEAHAQYEKYCLNRENCVQRLNPRLDMAETSLDDVDAIRELQAKTINTMQTDAVYKSQVTQTAQVLVSSLFYFEFDEVPQRSEANSNYACTGTIACRFPEDERLVADLHQYYARQACFYMGDRALGFEIPQALTFLIGSLEKPIDIALVIGSHRISISGQPNTARSLLQLQERYTKVSQKRDSKRKRQQEYPSCKRAKTLITDQREQIPCQTQSV